MSKYDFEKGFKRLNDAMSGGAKEVPFIAQMHEFAMREVGCTGREFYTKPDLFVQGTCQICEEFGFDTPSFIWDAYNVEAEALGVPLVMFDDMAPALDNVKPFIETEKDLARLKSPDPATAGRMPFVAEVLHLGKEYTGYRPPHLFCAPFTMAAHLMTFELLVVNMRKNPSFVHKVMDFIVDEVLAPYAIYMKKQFPDCLVFDGSDATASLPFITDEMQEEFALGPILNLQQQLDFPCFVDNWWGDYHAKDRERFWDNKLKATPEYLKTQDPDTWKMGLQDFMRYAGERDVPVVLGIDNNLFQNGPEEAIRRRIHEYMEVIETEGKGRGCVYFCSLSAVTPAQHVRIAIDAVRQFREGDRRWAGEYLAGSAEALGEEAIGQDENLERQLEIAAANQAEIEVTPTDILLDDVFDAVLDHEDELTAELVTKGLNSDVSVHSLLDDALIAAMDEVGEEFAKGKIFVPEMLMAARAMKAGLEILRPTLTQSGEPPKGLVLLATVQGDVHDIGKNLVGMMLEGAGYEVVDMGVNATPEEILERANELSPDVVGLSALLTTSMPSMQKTVALFKKVKSAFPVIVGGAPVTEHFAEVIGADGYGENAPTAVETVHRLVNQKVAANTAA